MGMAFGQGETGVAERVEQSPAKLRLTIDSLMDSNPSISIENIEFDIFGFSRGAAAARHFANEVLKANSGVVSESLNPKDPAFSPGFALDTNLSINFIGLFDTVAAIGDPTRGHPSPPSHRAHHRGHPSPLVGSSGEIGGSPPFGDPPPKSPLKWPRGAFPPLHRWWARVGSMLGSGGLGSSPPVGLARALHPSAPSLLSAWPSYL